VNVETSQPPSPLIRKCFHTYIRLFVKAIGSRVSGSGTAYAYLARTIPRFYSAEELADIMREAGFGKVTFRRCLFGVVAIHQACKLR
jgi:ubiquinone/menaquinone biosynthesis C-methylase UbiE